MKQQRAERKAAGLCVICGQPRLPDNKNYCPVHREIYRTKYLKDYSRKHRHAMTAAQIEYRARLRAQGLCIRCKKPQAPTSTWLCQECLEKSRENDRARYREQREQNREEREKQRERSREKRDGYYIVLYHKRKESGLCVRCGKPTEGKVICKTCKEKSKKPGNTGKN